jgi:hypothetical protein
MLPVDQWAGLPVHHRLQVEVAALFAITDAPLDTVEDPLLQRVLHALIAIGRSDPPVHIGSEGFKLTRSRTRSTMISEADQIEEAVMARFAEM